MELEQALVALFKSKLTGVVSRVHVGGIPQETGAGTVGLPPELKELPAIILQRVSTNGTRTQAKPAGTFFVSVQVDVFANNEEDGRSGLMVAYDAARRLRRAVDDYKGTVVTEDGSMEIVRAFYDGQTLVGDTAGTGIGHVRCDYRFAHREGVAAED